MDFESDLQFSGTNYEHVLGKENTQSWNLHGRKAGTRSLARSAAVPLLRVGLRYVYMGSKK